MFFNRGPHSDRADSSREVDHGQEAERAEVMAIAESLGAAAIA